MSQSQAEKIKELAEQYATLSDTRYYSDDKADEAEKILHTAIDEVCSENEKLRGEVAAARNAGVMDAIKIIESGRFLHDQSPAALFAKEVVAAIKRESALQAPAAEIEAKEET